MNPFLAPTYNRIDLVFERGEGSYLISTDGRRYLDFAAGIGVNALGHAHPRVVAALKTQAEKLWHISNLYRIPGQERVAERLVRNSFADTVFFVNSGAEAMETAFKAARKYHHDNDQPQRYRIVTATSAFHGRTLATIAAAKQEKLVKGFGPQMDGFDQVPFGDPDAVQAAIGPDTAAICVEPVQGEGGIRAADGAYLRTLRTMADQAGLLLILDEVQCGNGRTGKLFAHEWANVQPDILATAKGLANGFPIGACLMTEKGAKGLVRGTHGSTFGGNPLAMAVADAVLDELLADGFLDQVVAKGQRLRAGLERLADRYPQVIADVRGLGLMLGLGLTESVPNTEMQAALRAQGLLTVSARENVIRLLPPLTLEPSEIDEAISLIDAAVTAHRADQGNTQGTAHG